MRGIRTDRSRSMGLSMKVIVLHGEVPEGAGKDEKDVLVQVDIVSRALAEQGYEPMAVPVSLDFSSLINHLSLLQPDFVFNLVESISGQGRLIHMAPSLLDYLKIPYTGAKAEAVFLTSNKLLAKQMLKQNGLATPVWISSGEPPAGNFLPGLYVIKSVWEHASVGLDENSIIQVHKESDLDEMMASRREVLGGSCFAETFIDGREFNLSLLAGPEGPEVLSPAEIRFDDFPPGKIRIVGYRAKWQEDSFEYHHTRRSFEFLENDLPLLQLLTELAVKCWQLFGLKGYARVDFRVDPSGQPWILEVNTNPCLSPDGGFYAAAERAGLTFNQVIKRIIDDL